MDSTLAKFCQGRSVQFQKTLSADLENVRHGVDKIIKEKAAFTELFCIIKETVRDLKNPLLKIVSYKTKVIRRVGNDMREHSFTACDITFNGEDKLSFIPTKNQDPYSLDIFFNNEKNNNFSIVTNNNNWIIRPNIDTKVTFEDYYTELNKESIHMLLGCFFYRNCF
ncbi:hypothetical protein AB6825_22995 [Serratia proteamaculans]|uniref:hypothetical protein n=1 Tax=Serratia proteamaculans TaxID=28151 RepID=UPI0039BDE8D0